MTLDEVIEIIKSGEEMDLEDSRLAFSVVFGCRDRGLSRLDLRDRIAEKLLLDHPEQFDDLNHAHHGPEISFTAKELELINRMAAIASAAPWGHRDYVNWTRRDSKPFDCMRNKVHELLRRLKTK